MKKAIWLFFLFMLIALPGCEAVSGSGGRDPAAGSPGGGIGQAETSPPGERPGEEPIAQKEALRLAQASEERQDAAWSARLVYDYISDWDIDKRMCPVWIVEALFPEGNREIFHIDAYSGKLLTLTEAEASAGETPADGNNAFPLKLMLEKKDGCFRLKWDKSQYPDAFIVQSIQSQDRRMPVIHLVRRLQYYGDKWRYMMDAVAVNPAEGSYRIFPLADVQTKDTYSVDSVTRAYGFADPEHLVMLKPVEAAEGGALQYNIVSLHIMTGEEKVLIGNALPDISPDFLAAGWVNRDGSKLYANSFRGGRMWIANLLSGRVEEEKSVFKSSWPMASLYPSPDGERFSYQSSGVQLYDGSGRLLADFAGQRGFYSQPAICWSPDSRYALMEYTLDQDEANIISSDDGLLNIASQGVRLLDREGRELWRMEKAPSTGLHLEWAGWLAGSSQLVMHEYVLERQGEGSPRKTGSSYSLADASTGSVVPLRLAEELSDLPAPEAVFGKSTGKLVFVDRKAKLYWTWGAEYEEAGGEHGELLSREGSKQLVWAKNAYDRMQATVYQYNPQTRAVTETVFKNSGQTLQLFGESLVFDSDMNYYDLK